MTAVRTERRTDSRTAENLKYRPAPPEAERAGTAGKASCWSSPIKGVFSLQGGATKLKEYMRSLNILPHKRKRKLADGVPRSPRSPRSPGGNLPGMRAEPCPCRALLLTHQGLQTQLL